MRRWLHAAASAATDVADRPSLWLAGGLAWTVSVGWLALLIGVARGPSVAELTFFGARLFTSGAWPWNAVALGAVGLALLLVAFALSSTAEAALLRGRRLSSSDAARLFLIAIVAALPVLAVVGVLGIGVAFVAPREFNAPGDDGPLLRTALRLLPFIVAALVAMAVAGTVHAAAGRRALAERSSVVGLARAPGMLWRGGASVVFQSIVLVLARFGYLAIAATLLRVLWAPIGERLERDGIDPVHALLLVGFVAIWLCLVLGGGALHAWGSIAWTRVLDTPVGDRGLGSERMETRTGP